MSGAEARDQVVSQIDAPGSDGIAFTHCGVTYHLEPKALSSKVIKALVRLYDEQLRMRRTEFMQALHEAKTEQEVEIVKDMFGFVSGRFDKVEHMLQTPEGVACILHLCCDEIDSLEEAMLIVEEHDNFLDLIKVIGDATAMEAVGN